MMKQSKKLSYSSYGSGNIFYALFIPEGPIKDCIDAIRYISSPTEKKSAHITVRGPYKEQIKKSRLEKLNFALRGNLVHISNPGNFFNNKDQNTVFFNCQGTQLESVWKKKDYGYHPHITLYDGSDKSFAQELYNVLGNYQFDLSFEAEKLVMITRSKGQTSMELSFSLNNELFRPWGKDFLNTTHLIDNMSTDEKISLISKITKNLQNLSIETTSSQPKVSFINY